MKRSVPWVSVIIIRTFKSIDTVIQFHLAQIQVQKMRIKEFLIYYNKIKLFAENILLRLLLVWSSIFNSSL